MTIDRRIPPEFLAGLTEFDGETVIGFRALTEVIPESRDPKPNGNIWHTTRVVGYQLVTEKGITEFALDGMATRASAIHPTVVDNDR